MSKRSALAPKLQGKGAAFAQAPQQRQEFASQTPMASLRLATSSPSPATTNGGAFRLSRNTHRVMQSSKTLSFSFSYSPRKRYTAVIDDHRCGIAFGFRTLGGISADCNRTVIPVILLNYQRSRFWSVCGSAPAIPDQDAECVVLGNS